MHVELAIDRAEVRVNSAKAHDESLGHLRVGATFGDQRQDLEFPTGEPTNRLLPDLLYRGSLAPTKPYSPNPSTRVSGTVTLDGRELRVEGAAAQQGHLAGGRHAERWAWANCSDFEGEEAVVQALTAQGRRGPLTTPYTTFVSVLWQGRWVRLSKVSGKRDFGLGTWRIDLANRRHRLTGRIEAPVAAMIRARYQDPDGVPRFCHNSEIASARLALFERKAGGFEEIALLVTHFRARIDRADQGPCFCAGPRRNRGQRRGESAVARRRRHPRCWPR